MTTTTATMRQSLPRAFSNPAVGPAALHPSNSTSRKSGALVVKVVSANSLSPTIIQPPTFISLQVAGTTARTGPPTARHHMNGTSFKFDNGFLSINMPLAILYKSKAVMTIEYPNPNENLTAIFDCNKLTIHQTTPLTLKLKRVVPPEVTTSIAQSLSGDSHEESSNSACPSISLQVRLEGPMRTEVIAIMNLTRAWFHLVDTAESALSPVLQNLPSAMYLSLLLIPSVPLLTTALVVSPILIGLSIVFFPIVLPCMILGGIVLAFWTSLVGVILASTRQGRLKIYSTMEPTLAFLTKQPAMQIMIYDTGSRPTPVTLVQAYVPTDMMSKLCISILMDTLGSCSYIVPGIGESFDLVWCPTQTILIKAMYQEVAPNLTYISFAEEFLPFTDVLPSATLGWASEFLPTVLKLVQQEWNNNGGGVGFWKKYTTNSWKCDENGTIKMTMAHGGGVAVRSS